MSVADSPPHSLVATFYEDHHRFLQDWLRRKVGCPVQAADLTQDTFLRLLSAPAQCHANIIEPRSYLTTVAKRVMFDHFRRQALERAWIDVLDRMPEPLVQSPEQRALVFEALFEIDAILDGLGRNVRQAFLLSLLEDLSHAEIAERLSVSVSAVKKYKTKATNHCLMLAA